MLDGAARKVRSDMDMQCGAWCNYLHDRSYTRYRCVQVAVPFTLLSLAGWVTFGVGFGIRNFE